MAFPLIHIDFFSNWEPVALVFSKFSEDSSTVAHTAEWEVVI